MDPIVAAEFAKMRAEIADLRERLDVIESFPGALLEAFKSGLADAPPLTAPGNLL